jgi:hypothetical protein
MPTWTFYGRVLPERVPITWYVPVCASAKGPFGIAFDYRLSIIDSQVIVDITVTAGTPDTATTRNLAENCIRAVTDLVGYKRGIHFDVDIVSGVCRETGQWEVFGIGIPVLVARRRPEDLGPIDGNLVAAVHCDISAQMALADFREAMRVPVGTGFFCYRAIEALMQSMRANAEEDLGSISWPRFRKTLCVERGAIDLVKQYADKLRHGRPFEISDADRAKVLSITDEIIRRYLEHLVRGRVQLPEGEFPDLAG